MTDAKAVAPTVWSLWHFQTDTLEWGMEDDELPHLLIGCFAARATAAELRARLATRPGFRDWPQGFRIFRRRLGVAFGLEGFRERYGWEAWRDSLRG
jgi:hypothetical protein